MQSQAFIPNDIEAVRDLADDRSIYLAVRPDGASQSVVAIFVDDLDERVARIAERGFEPTMEETYGNLVRKVVYRDPDQATPTALSGGRRAAPVLTIPSSG